MNDQHYATPTAELTSDSGNLSDILKPLTATRPWVRLCSILGFISTFFMIIAGVGLMVGSTAMSGQAASGMPFPLSAVGFFYLIIGLFYLMPSIYLFKYASAIRAAEASHAMQDITAAMTFQKSFWKFVGIVALIMMVIMLIGIGAAVMIPMMS
jgi:hypothetical protein